MTRFTIALGLCLFVGLAPLSRAADAWSQGGHLNCCARMGSPGSAVLVQPHPGVIVRPSTVVVPQAPVVIVPQHVLSPVPRHPLGVPFVNRRLPVSGCCTELFPDPAWLSSSYMPLGAYSPPVAAVPPPPVVYVTPTAPDLAYIPPPPVEPAPEIKFPTGRWERHGNGVDYPYVWVWVAQGRATSAVSRPTPPAPPSAPSTP